MECLTDLTSELAVLSACINHGADCFLDVSELVNNDTFSDEQAQAIWKCLSEIYKGETKKADLPSILVAAKQIGLEVFFQDESRQKILSKVLRFQIEPENALSFSKKLRKLQITRDLAKGLQVAHKDIQTVNGSEKLDTIIAKAEKPIFDIINQVAGSNDNDGIVHISTGLRELIQNIEENPNQLDGIPSGFQEWDNSLGGGLGPGVHVIAARAKGAKSTTADNICINITLNNVHGLMIDTEMQIKKHHFRLMSLLSGVPVKEIRAGQYTNRKTDVDKIRRAEEQLNQIPYSYLQASTMSMEERLSYMRRWLLRTVGYGPSGKINPCVIFYDQLKITDQKDISGAIKEYQALGFQMDALNNFSVQYNVPIVALCQLNRDGISDESSASVANSDRIVQHCTSLTFLKWKSPEEVAQDGPELGNKKMVVIESRDGEGHRDGNYVHLGTKLSIAKVWELGSTTKPKRMKQSFDVEAIQEINF